MILKGWTNPLPDWIVAYIHEGKLVVNVAKDYEYLQGAVVNPQGTRILFM